MSNSKTVHSLPSILSHLMLFICNTSIKLFKLFAYNDDQKRKHFFTRFVAELTQTF